MKENGEENGKDWRTIGLFKKSERSLKETIRPICSLSLSHSHPHSLFRIQTGKGIPSRVDGRSESKMKKKKRKTSWKNPKRTGIRVRALRNDGQTIRKASDSTNNAKYGADNDGLAWVNHVTRVHRADVGKSFCKWTLSRERERGRGGFAGLSRIRGVFWDAAGPVYRCQWITPPCLCCLSNSRHRGNAKFPVALALAKARVHVHTDDCPTRGRDIEGGRKGHRCILDSSTCLSLFL